MESKQERDSCNRNKFKEEEKTKENVIETAQKEEEKFKAKGKIIYI